MIELDRTNPKPLYQQLYEQFRHQIMVGTYPQGTRLPPIRQLADDLGIARNTVEGAYFQLAQEGYVSSRAGSGFVVQQLDLLPKNAHVTQKVTSETFVERLRQTGLWNDEDNTDGDRAPDGRSNGGIAAHARPQPLSDSSESNVLPVAYDFTYGNLQANSFPAQLWRRLVSEVLAGQDARRASTYGDGLGERGLRQQIAQALNRDSGVNCHPAQVVVRAGTQASLYNLLTLFDPMRDVIAMEEPGYDGARTVFENARFGLFPVPVTEGDDAFIAGLCRSGARLAYVTPSNQFPTGRILQQAARQRLLKWADETDAYIIEDDYCREFRYRARPLPSLQSLDRNGRVIYMGTFSKALSPALRMNYLVLPPDLLFSWRKLFANHYPEVPWLSQAVLQSYMEKGYWDRHLRKAQAYNKRKYQLLVGALRARMGKRVDVMENGSGLHLLVGPLDGRPQDELVALARRGGVKVYGTDRYWMSAKHPLENYVLVGFSAIRAEQIEPGIARLAEAWFC
ncbi:MAG: PLP-dependent aminotransferase family protein [Coriobacteriales bacterium]|jgi:GntR family transcriptional regulator/MocR family aminotransferase|nr:PLP-dependent aminotransferase family protein [Coriobacteriales bacterium]